MSHKQDIDARLTSAGKRRRRLMQFGGSALAAGAVGAPGLLHAQPKPVLIGAIGPLTGALTYNGTQAQAGIRFAVDVINSAGGIKSMGGAPLEVMFADAESRPDVGAAQVDKLAQAGVAVIVGAQSSAITLATTQAAARFGIPHVADIGSAPQLLRRGLNNVFRFSPGVESSVATGIGNLDQLNKGAGSPVKRVAIVHEDGPFGSGMAKTLNEQLPTIGMEVVEVLNHPTPQRDFSNIVLRLRQAKPDLIMPSHYINEFILFARTLRQQRVQVKGMYSIFGGGASNIRFVREHNEAAQHIIDTNHWYDPNKPLSKELARRTAAAKLDLTYDIMVSFACMQLIADALEKTGSADRAALIKTFTEATFADTIMPYRTIKFEGGDNTGSQLVNTQIRGNNIELIYPKEFATVEPIFPMPTSG